MKVSDSIVTLSVVLIPISLVAAWWFGLDSICNSTFRIKARVQTSEMYALAKTDKEYRKELIKALDLPWADFDIEEGRFLTFRLNGVEYGYSKGELMSIHEGQKLMVRMMEYQKAKGGRE